MHSEGSAVTVIFYFKYTGSLFEPAALEQKAISHKKFTAYVKGTRCPGCKLILATDQNAVPLQWTTIYDTSYIFLCKLCILIFCWSMFFVALNLLMKTSGQLAMEENLVLYDLKQTINICSLCSLSKQKYLVPNEIITY